MSQVPPCTCVVLASRRQAGGALHVQGQLGYTARPWLKDRQGQEGGKPWLVTVAPVLPFLFGDSRRPLGQEWHFVDPFYINFRKSVFGRKRQLHYCSSLACRSQSVGRRGLGPGAAHSTLPQTNCRLQCWAFWCSSVPWCSHWVEPHSRSDKAVSYPCASVG